MLSPKLSRSHARDPPVHSRAIDLLLPMLSCVRSGGPVRSCVALVLARFRDLHSRPNEALLFVLLITLAWPRE